MRRAHVGLWKLEYVRAIQECVLTLTGASAVSRPSGKKPRCSINYILGVCKAGVWWMSLGGLGYCVMNPAYMSDAYGELSRRW
jgi:hypothetical protein